MYLLDTNVISHAIREPSGQLARQLREKTSGELLTSIIVQAELRFGYTKSGSARQKQAVEAMLEPLRVEDWSAPADKAYAKIRSELELSGRPIGQNDMLIAAHALALDVTLVTDNLREFSRIADLKIENWLRDVSADRE